MRVLFLVHSPRSRGGMFRELAPKYGAKIVEWSFREQDGVAQGPPETDGVIAFGGPMNVDEDDLYPWLKRERRYLRFILREGVPYLGICLGMQLAVEALGGEVVRMRRPELGFVKARFQAKDDTLLSTLSGERNVLSWHRYGASSLPRRSQCLGVSDLCPQAVRLGDRQWGLQFHPEAHERLIRLWLAGKEAEGYLAEAKTDREEVLENILADIRQWEIQSERLFARFLAVVEGRATRARALDALPARDSRAATDGVARHFPSNAQERTSHRRERSAASPATSERSPAR